MNSDEMKGKWNQLKGSAKSQWGKLTDDDLTQVEGDRDKLVGKIQEKYGVAREEAEKQVNDWDTAA
ncbi:CsbD family protein [Hyphococcus sp.]|uniref:CsbD family protein n=1 Tax=Hyphococcus sp. TaxID=2038636 RepID=UPI0035C78992